MIDDEEIVGSGQLPSLRENEFLFWEYGVYWYNAKEDASNHDSFVEYMTNRKIEVNIY